MAKDPELLAHQEWLGYLQPVGLVVSPAALLEAQAHVSRDVVKEQLLLRERVSEMPVGESQPRAAVNDLRGLLCGVFGWRSSDLVGGPGAEGLLESVGVILPEYNETLRPTYAVREVAEPSAQAEAPWMMLIQVLPIGTPLDRDDSPDDHHWKASPQARFERLLRETSVPIGLLVNGTALRLVYAPHGESSGHLTFPIQGMTEVAGRPILAGLCLLLRSERLFTLPARSRLPAILAASRRFQNTVSTRLAEQVLAALFELLRGFQAADEKRKGELLRVLLDTDPDQIYAGLLTVLLRLVFLLYAEDRGLMASDPLYVNHYAITGLFERLRADAGRFPDTMDQRYGAWAQLLALFRIVHDGARGGGLKLPARKGYLFDPERYRFLEGRHAEHEPGQRIEAPMVPDGVVFRVLNNLLILDGERLSYRSLDVEHIGSIYESMMGFRLEKAEGPSIAVKATKAHGAPVTINLAALLAVVPGERGKWLKTRTDQTLTGEALNKLKAARTPEDVVAALEKKIARKVTRNIVAAGSMVLQPSDERRRSGSHYTPRSLTEPIVRKALEPVLKGLASGGRQPPGSPTPEQILSLKVCDPAMGSGAFLVEACRQLGDALVTAWRVHDCLPRIPPDEDEVLHARRVVAQRCLYGVDRNSMAVDLAKLSLWLATLAKDHPFTFLDHVLRCGDSLVGLTRRQIAGFHWAPAKADTTFVEGMIREKMSLATTARREIFENAEYLTHLQKAEKLRNADSALDGVRLVGNLVLTAFFAGDNAKKRLLKRTERFKAYQEYRDTRNTALLPPLLEAAESLKQGERPIAPFHWEIEFPEVFDRENGGFDAIVGNPPFAGKNTIGAGNAEGYLDWLKALHEESHGNADLVAHFFRRAFTLLRQGGCFGLIATNTIAQGDTRSTGLRWICTHGGTIYTARKRLKWPGMAAVVVSVVHICRGALPGPFDLDGKKSPLITAFLFHAGGHDDPAPLKANANRSFQGSIVLGMGFTFDDTDRDGVTSPIAEMHRLIAKDERNAERIFPYIGGEEVNDSPMHAHHRYVINFGEMTEEEARQWPDLMRIVEEKVKPQRMKDNRDSYRTHWWQFAEKRGELTRVTKQLKRVIAVARVGQHGVFTFLVSGIVYSEQLVVSALSSYSGFCALQSRVHEVWARFFGSSMKDDLRYTPSDCFETFPFPANFETNPGLENAGRDYYEFRADLMVRNNEGLTKSYNRFHDPNERSDDLVRLRELHAVMDRAVLDAYGWTDLQPTCEFLLDYAEDEEDEAPSGKQKKKPWRWRWPDDFRDEVLARLLALNKQRAEQEALAGSAVEPKTPSRTGPVRNPPQTPELF